MKNYIILLIKGFLIGIGKIIPGVSGAMIAISFRVYEKGINAISHFFSDIKKNIQFLLPLGIGILLGIFLFSKIIVNLLEVCYLPIMLLFIGLILGSIGSIIKNIKLNKNNVLLFIIVVLLSLSLSFIKGNNSSNSSFIIIIVMGLIEAASMIIPGLSGTALLMVFGYYSLIMNAFSTIDLSILFPFSIGIIIGGLIITKIIDYLFKRHKEKTYVTIYALSISSVLLLFLQTFQYNYRLIEILISIVLLFIGYYITRMIEK